MFLGSIFQSFFTEKSGFLTIFWPFFSYFWSKNPQKPSKSEKFQKNDPFFHRLPKVLKKSRRYSRAKNRFFRFSRAPPRKIWHFDPFLTHFLTIFWAIFSEMRTISELFFRTLFLDLRFGPKTTKNRFLAQKCHFWPHFWWFFDDF